MHECHNYEQITTRRGFLERLGLGLGGLALSSLVNPATGYSPHIVPQSQTNHLLVPERWAFTV